MNLLLPVSVCAIGAVLSIESSHINTIININIDIDIAIDIDGRRFVFNIGGRAGATCVWGIGAWGCLPL